MANEQNLKPFKPGNPGGPGRPKGRKSLSTIVRDILEQEVDWKKLPVKNTDEFEERYGSKTILAEAMVRAAVVEALSKNGHQAREWLRKSGYGDKLQLEGGENPIPILGSINVSINESSASDSGDGQEGARVPGGDVGRQDGGDLDAPDSDSPDKTE